MAEALRRRPSRARLSSDGHPGARSRRPCDRQRVEARASAPSGIMQRLADVPVSRSRNHDSGLPATIVGRSSPAPHPVPPTGQVGEIVRARRSDVVARIMSLLGDFLGQQVIIENRAGDRATSAWSWGRAAPDGHTIYLGNIRRSHNPAIYRNLPVDPQKDLVPITLVADVASILVANPGFPPNTVAELIAWAKANPGALNFASTGSGALSRLEMEQLRKVAGLDLVHIPYKGAPACGHRLARGRNARHVRDAALGDHERRGRQVEAARHLDSEAGRCIARRGQRLVARHVRAGGHAAPDRGEAPCGDPRDADVARHHAAPRRRRRHDRDQQDAGRVRRFRSCRSDPLGPGGEAVRRDGRHPARRSARRLHADDRAVGRVGEEIQQSSGPCTTSRTRPTSGR